MASLPAEGAPSGAESARHDVPALELALLALIAFLPSVATAYVYDDVLLIRDNPHAHELSEVFRAFTTYFWQVDERATEGLDYYRPIVTVSFIVNWVLGAGRPWIFHFTNVLLHAGVTYLVALFARRMTGSRVLSIAIALVFALHPSRTQSVEWISGRTDVLAAFFVMLSLELLYRSASPGAGIGKGGRVKPVLAVACTVSFVLALMSKETSVMFPLLALAEVFATDDAARRRALLRVVAATAVIAGIYVALRLFVFPIGGNSPSLTPQHGFLTVWSYAERISWPWPQTFFPRPLYVENGRFVYPPHLVAGGVVVVLVHVGLVVQSSKRDPTSAVLLVAAAAAFGPLLNFVFTGVAARTFDHYLYLPLLVLCVGICRRFSTALSAMAGRRGARIAFGAVVAAYLSIDLLRARDYCEQEFIFLRELELNPFNHVALKTMSGERAREGRFDEAYDYLVRSTQPDSRRYSLLTTQHDRPRTYMRLLTLQAARTADGNVADLEKIYADLRAFTATPGKKGPVAGDVIAGLPRSEVFIAPAESWNERELAAAEVAFTASRLGHDDAVRTSLEIVEGGYLESLTNFHNTALAYARVEDFAGARRYLERVTRELSYRLRSGEFDELRVRLGKAERLFARAAAASGNSQRKLRAQAYLELGAYLRALRELRPVVELYPDDPDAGQLYVLLLLAAGLDDEAGEVLVRALGDAAHADEAMKSLRLALPPRVLTLRKPSPRGEGAVDWFTAPEIEAVP
jgi:tetratricopeptide (TPR) repeat protein